MAEHFPAPWSVHTLTATIYAADVPKGPARVADMRGWGYLTGKGNGALALPEDEAIEIQRANAAHIVKCVNAFPDLVKALDEIAARARFELEMPTEMRDTAFSLIEKCARGALAAVKGAPDHG